MATMTAYTQFRFALVIGLVCVLTAFGVRASAQVQVPAPERLCDTQFEDCRQPILDLINNESLGIDVGSWYMLDSRYADALIARFQAGVPVRMLVDNRANPTYTGNGPMLQRLAAAGIPMREKVGEDVLHWKVMLFHGQNMVNFSKGNFEPFAYVPTSPTNYEDEAVYFTNDDRITNSFRRRFDDRWVDTTVFQNFKNITGTPTRKYPLYTIDPAMSFSADHEDFTDRWIKRMDLENVGVDAIVFRVMEDRAADAVLRAVGRKVPVRIISEPQEYRNIKRLPDSKQIDRMYIGGAQIKFRQHAGLTHEALIQLRGLGETIFGSANWTLASALYQDEHNIFVGPTFGKPWFFQWFANQFTNKWNSTNFVPFQPLPPDPPVYSVPNNGSTVTGTSVTLKWDGGPWSWFYDIYFGTTSNPPLLVSSFRPPQDPDANGTLETYTINNLQPGTTYFWKIVDRTWAQKTAAKDTDSVWSFTTAGAGGGGLPFGGTPWPIPGKIEAENFDEGGPFVGYSDTTPGNAYGAWRSTDVDIEATSDTGGGYDVAKTRTGEWLKYTINVTAAGTYPLTLRVASAGSGATMHVELDGVDKTGPIALPNTGGWQTWQTTAPINVAFTAGTHTLRVAFDNQGSAGGVGNYNWLQVGTSSGGGGGTGGSTPHNGTPASIPGTFQAEDFDDGGLGIAYNDTTSGNAYGACRTTDVDVETTSDTGGGCDVGKTKAGEWLKYTVNVTAAGTYPFTLRVANVGTGGRLHVEVDGVDKTGPISLPDTGGWQTWTNLAAPSLSLTAGSHVIRVFFDVAGSGGGVGNYNWFKIGS
jgi:phosphatidylserine/phosphatidylglycerophosphate/cardiolipin synthase-like enzyme